MTSPEELRGMDDRHIADRPHTPNLFVVGAPKCGTTSLCHYLGSHPDVHIARQKEPLFFCSDQTHTEPWKISRADEYLALFEPGAGLDWRGEGSVWYLSSRVAAQRIRAVSPDARIIIMLRNPVDMAASLHAQFLYSGNETIRDFEAAYAAQPARRRGAIIPSRAHAPDGLLYTEVGRYAEQVERYLSAFARDRVAVLIFEEFFADPGREYAKVLAFLGLEREADVDFTARNERHAVQSVSLQRFLVKLPELWDAPRRLPPGRIRDALGRRLERLNAALVAYNNRGGRLRLPPETRRRLHADFADDIARLEDLLGRSLDVWSRRNLGVAEPAAAAVRSPIAH